MEPFEMTLLTATAELKEASRARRIATEACEEYVGVVQQSDAWLHIDETGGGVLVRRSMIGTSAVIVVERDSRGPVALERHRFTPVVDPDRIPEPWAGTEELVRVTRGREVWLADNVRVYIDTIPGVGSYCAMEAVVDEAHPRDACRTSIRTLLRQMEIPLDALLTRTYGEIALGQDAPDVAAERDAEIESMKKKIEQLRDLAEE